MILVAGIPSEPPLATVLDRLSDLRADVLVVNQRQFADLDLAFVVDERGRVDGLLRVGRRHVALREVSAVYVRLMDFRNLPEYRRLPEDDPERMRCALVMDEISAWVDVSPGRVVNRTSAMASNGSKPYQGQLIECHGLRTPETLVTNDPEQARAFYASRDRVVYKSASGVRSIVQTMAAADADRLELVRACPVQFQTWVPGLDVRVHVIGGEVFATAVTTTATDYRYAARQVDEAAGLEAYELDGEIAGRCVALAADLGLEFAGVDLKLTPDGEVYCFEVNPSPAYTYFEDQTKQPIAAALARHLAG
ncbi:MAG: hypothetical protein ABIW80_13210 [Lapillicoccus sp.]